MSGRPVSIPRSAIRLAFRSQKRARLHARRWTKLLRIAGEQLRNGAGFFNPFYAPPGEMHSCPACGSRELKQLDVMWQRHQDSPRHAAFMSGCRTCGLVFVNPLPTEEELAAYYAPEAEYAADFNKREAVRGRAVASTVKPSLGSEEHAKLRLLFEPVATLVDVASPPPDARVLDYGCGPGRMLDRLQPAGWITYGIEPALKTAFSRHRELATPPDEPTFHLVTLHHVLEHLRNPLDVLKALSRSMVDGGVMYVSVPRLDAVAVHGDLHYCINPHGHIVSYTRACMTTLLAMAGLRVIDAPDDHKIDDLLTGGVPRRLRVFALKDGGPLTRPAAPLRAAEEALRAYHARAEPGRWRLAALAPVRLRAGWLQHARTRRMLTYRLQRMKGSP